MPRRAITKCQTPSLLFFEPPKNSIPELDFTQYDYLFVDEDGDILAELTLETIAALIIHPTHTDNNLFNSFFMREIGSDASPKPAHFPNIHDTHPIKHEFEVFLIWCLGSLPPSTFNPELMKPAMHLLDPKPNINLSCPIYELDDTSIRMCVGAFTDTFQICRVPPFPHVLHIRVLYSKLPNNVPGYHMVDLTPYDSRKAEDAISGHFGPLSLNSLVCIWNVRGIGRPSFIENFTTMYKIHMPLVVILLETRHGHQIIKKLVKQLPGDYGFGLSSPNEGLCGGVAYLWKGDIVGIKAMGVYTSKMKIDIFVKGHPKARRILF